MPRTDLGEPAALSDVESGLAKVRGEDWEGVVMVRTDFGKDLRRRTDVGVPAQPAGVPAIEVLAYVWEVELLDRVGGEVPIVRSGTRALGHAHVGNHVSERIRLYCSSISTVPRVQCCTRHTNCEVDLDIGVLGDDARNDINILRLVQIHTILINLQLAIGRRRRTVTIRQIVHDERGHQLRAGCVLLLDVGEVRLERGDLGTRVHPYERSDLGYSRSRRVERRREGGNGEVVNFGGVVGIGVELVACERVA